MLHAFLAPSEPGANLSRGPSVPIFTPKMFMHLFEMGFCYLGPKGSDKPGDEAVSL